ncbi:hypothetical protein [Paracholeplasma manati]|uniref:hypothetical protein n=1 Tax=Paracholeplasma manati TaxID=591373 RepID=UPI0024079AE7|nr:hypothetical protein [Paracholeplasma manati]
MTIFSYVVLIFPLILILMIVKFKKKSLLFLLPMLFIGSSIGIWFTLTDASQRPSFDYTYITLKSNDYTHLMLQDDVLIDGLTQEMVTYHTNLSKTTIPTHRPIFLYETETYYFLIYTTNTAEHLDNQLFTLYDYEFNKVDHNVMIILSKTTGQMAQFHQYEYIGKTIDLSRVKSTSQMLFLPVMKDYTLDIAYYAAIFVVEDEFLVSFDAFGFASINDHQIIQFEAFNTYSIGLLSDGSFELVKYTYNIHYETIHGKLVVDHISYRDQIMDTLKDETYISQGYFHVNNDVLYYIDNDLNLCAFDDGKITIIKPIQHLDNWINEINN